jgi:hypothetical protein
MQSCIDPTLPTPEEKALEKSLPETERNRQSPTVSSEASLSTVSSSTSAGVSLSVSTMQYGFSQAMRPVDINGQPLSDTYYLWSGRANKEAAKNMIAQKGGWLMSQTPQHVVAASQYSAALRREASVAFPGRTFTDQELFAMAESEQLRLPTAEMLAIWGPPSAEVSRNAVFGGLPVQGNLVSPAGPDTVQTLFERPAVRSSGLVMGGVQMGAGALNVYAGTQEENSFLGALGISGGSAQIAGGVVWAYGAARTSAPLMSAGLKMSVVGTVVTAPIIAVHAAEDLQSGNEYRQLRGALNAVGIVAPPAAFLSTYNEQVVKPAAETFYEVARRDIASMLGVPQSWVY